MKPNMSQIMQQAQKMQDEMHKAQESLENISDAGVGLFVCLHHADTVHNNHPFTAIFKAWSCRPGQKLALPLTFAWNVGVIECWSIGRGSDELLQSLFAHTHIPEAN